MHLERKDCKQYKLIEVVGKMEILNLITYGIIGIVSVIVISILIIRRRQKNRMAEARMRGIKDALREQKQYETLRKLEGKQQETQIITEEDRHLNSRREIRR